MWGAIPEFVPGVRAALSAARRATRQGAGLGDALAASAVLRRGPPLPPAATAPAPRLGSPRPVLAEARACALVANPIILHLGVCRWRIPSIDRSIGRPIDQHSKRNKCIELSTGR